MANITLYVQSLINTSANLSITINNESTIAQLKTQINLIEGTPKNIISLFFNNNALQDVNTISSYGITTGSYIQSSNNISEYGLWTKQQKQEYKLQLAQLKKQANGDINKPYYKINNTFDVNRLPSKYVDNISIPNNNSNVTLRRPWKTGSLLFGSTDKFLSIPASNDWAVGTGNFCVEWFQYQTAASPPMFSRVFDVGDWPTESIGFSIENGVANAWLGNTLYNVGALSNYLNTWVHIAMIRTDNRLSVYKSGARVFSTISTEAANNSTSPLTIGFGSDNYWNGYMTNFRFVSGNSVYNAESVNIPIPTGPLTVVTGTKLLLLCPNSINKITDFSNTNKTVTNNGDNVTWETNTPF